jgi:homogentisate 1,2-dioxygenase
VADKLFRVPNVTSDTPQPISWQHGQALPTQNEWSWTNLSSVLYVEQPVGTGFSQGQPNAKVSWAFRMGMTLRHGANVHHRHAHGRMRTTLRASLSDFWNSFYTFSRNSKGRNFISLVKV